MGADIHDGLLGHVRHEPRPELKVPVARAAASDDPIRLVYEPGARRAVAVEQFDQQQRSLERCVIGERFGHHDEHDKPVHGLVKPPRHCESTFLAGDLHLVLRDQAPHLADRRRGADGEPRRARGDDEKKRLHDVARAQDDAPFSPAVIDAPPTVTGPSYCRG